jgi:hypothetical protein
MFFQFRWTGHPSHSNSIEQGVAKAQNTLTSLCSYESINLSVVILNIFLINPVLVMLVKAQPPLLTDITKRCRKRCFGVQQGRRPDEGEHAL